MNRSKSIRVAVAGLMFSSLSACALLKPPGVNVQTGSSHQVPVNVQTKNPGTSGLADAPSNAPVGPVGADVNATSADVAVNAQAKGSIGAVNLTFTGSGWPIILFGAVMGLIAIVFFSLHLKSKAKLDRRNDKYATLKTVTEKVVEAVKHTDSTAARAALDDAVCNEKPVVINMLNEIEKTAAAAA